MELKSIWLDSDKAAHRLAAHANAARGMPILWLIGVDEKSHVLTNIDPVELESWYKSVQRYFDGFAPRLLVDVVIGIESNTIMALFFDTEREAPYVVSNSKGGGGYPEFIVPWREGTRMRAARRDDLLRILIPIRRFSALLDELDFNIAISQSAAKGTYDDWGTPFREEEFHRALRDGAITTLPTNVKQLIHQSYVAMGRANQRVIAALNSSSGMRTEDRNAARGTVIDSMAQIKAAHDSLLNFLRQ